MKLFSLNKEYFFNLFYNYLYPQMCMKNAKILYIMKYFDFHQILILKNIQYFIYHDYNFSNLFNSLFILFRKRMKYLIKLLMLALNNL